MTELNDLRKIRHFVGVARAGSFTSASNVLALTQSALTKNVAELESLLGARLFDRTPRGVKLTHAGELFLPRAERLLADSADLLSDMRDVEMLASGRLRIGAPTVFAPFLESTVSAFAKVYPGMSVIVEDGAEDTIARGVTRGDLDIAVGNVGHLNAWQDLHTQAVAPLHLFFLARPDHPLTRVDTVSAQALLSYPVVMPSAGIAIDEELRRAYLQANMSPVPPRYRCNHFSLVKELVANTDAISPVVSLAAPAERFQARYAVFHGILKLTDQSLGVATSKRETPNPANKAFLDIFRGFLIDSRT